MNVLRSALIIAIMCCMATYSDFVYASDDAPYIANYYLNELQTSSSFIEEMALYDVLILTPSQIVSKASTVNQIRQKNKDIIILAYVPSQSYNYQYWPRDVIFRYMSGIQDSWWLRDGNGNRVSTWTGIYNTNMDPAWSRYLVQFANERVVNLSQVDGIFFDMISHNISWANGGNLDINNDGARDSAAQADALWLDRTTYLLKYAQEHLETDYIVINGSSHSAFQPYVNGRMFETFPTPWEGNGTWTENMDSVRKIKKTNDKPQLIVFNANSNNSGNQGDYKTMRFGFASSLLEDDVYFSFDHGDTNHGQTWWYDEYEIDLGQAIGRSSSKRGYSSYKEDVWQRQFENGISVVNSTSQTQTVSLGGEYEKIHGTQDKLTNDGSIVSEVTVPGKDGIVLLKTFDLLYDVLFTNGSFARFFRPDASRVRNGFFVFDDGYKGGTQIAYIDLDANGKRELIVVKRNKIEVWRDDGIRYMRVFPYTANFAGEITVAIGDIDENLRYELFVAPKAGHPGPIKIYNRFGFMHSESFYPFGTDYTGGYSLAVGDVDGLLNTELVVGRAGDMTQVYVYDRLFQLKYSWRPFESWFLGGANVATGDLDGDYIDEIIVGRGKGGKPEIGIYDARGNALYPRFEAYQSFGTPGVDVRTLDVDFDGRDDIMSMSEDGF